MEDSKGFINPTTFKAIQDYIAILSWELKKFSDDLKIEFKLLQKDSTKSIFIINRRSVSLPEFTLLLGRRFYECPTFSSRWPLSLTEEGLPHLKESFKNVRKFIREIPGAVLPSVPDELKEWLENQEK